MTMRHEYKYPLSADQDALLSAKAAGLMLRDAHADENGRYIVRSLYLDSLNDACFRDSLSERDPRAKYRLRYYNDDSTTMRLEKKIKQRDRCFKEVCSFSLVEFERMLRCEAPLISDDVPAIKRRLMQEIWLKGLRPSVIVTYEREAFVYPAGNVRVTFDRAVMSSGDVENFLVYRDFGRPIYAIGASLMEVKYDELFPRHIRGVLQIDGLTRTAFSKYVQCRLMHL